MASLLNHIRISLRGMGRVISFEDHALANLRARVAAAEEANQDLIAFARGHSGAVDRAAEMVAKEADQPVGGGDIGADGMVGAAPLAAEMLVPAKGEKARGMGVRSVGGQGISHRPMQRVSTRPRKMRSSEPWRVSKCWAPR